MIIPLIPTIYSGIFSIIGLVMSGFPTGVIVLVIGILAVINMKKLDTAYKQYLMTGQLPPAQI